jgi:hypothetical protein
MDNLENSIHLIRKQRHDFMNDLQVVYGYLQIGKNDNALKYIEKLSEENRTISSIYSLGDNFFGYCMEYNMKKLLQKNICVETNIEIEKFYKENFNKDYNEKCNLVNNIFSKFENNDIKNVYIYIFEDEMGQSLLVCNDESVADELSWMESWQKVDINLDNVSLHECSYGNNIGYRITFL